MVVAGNLPDVTSNKLAIQKSQDDWYAVNATLVAQYLAQVQADKDLANQRRQQEVEMGMNVGFSKVLAGIPAPVTRVKGAVPRVSKFNSMNHKCTMNCTELNHNLHHQICISARFAPRSVHDSFPTVKYFEPAIF